MPATKAIIARNASFPPIFGAPRADLSDLGLKLARLPNIAHGWFPGFNKPTAIAQFQDMAANDTWSSGAQANNPQYSVLNGQIGYSFSNASAQGLRLAKSDQHQSWTYLGVVEVTAANVAQQNASRTIVSKSNGTAIASLGTVYASGAQHWLIAQGGQNLIFPVVTAGVYVVCLSYNADDGSVILYANSADATVGVTTGAAGPQLVGPWTIGGAPGGTSCWEGKIGHSLILHQQLTGSAERDAFRRYAMRALADVYGVVLT